MIFHECGQLNHFKICTKTISKYAPNYFNLFQNMHQIKKNSPKNSPKNMHQISKYAPKRLVSDYFISQKSFSFWGDFVPQTPYQVLYSNKI